MLDDLKTFLKAGIDSVSGGSADGLPDAMVARAQAVAEQVTSLVGSFLEWSSEARASIRHEVKDAIDRQVRELGLATHREVESLRARVEELEREVAAVRARSKAARPRAKARGTG